MLYGDGTASDPFEKCTSVLLDKIFHGTLLSGPVSGTCKCEGLGTSSDVHTAPRIESAPIILRYLMDASITKWWLSPSKHEETWFFLCSTERAVAALQFLLVAKGRNPGKWSCFIFKTSSGKVDLNAVSVLGEGLNWAGISRESHCPPPWFLDV